MTNEPTYQWFVVDNPKRGKKAPKWSRSAGLRDDGTIWIPAAVLGSEMEVLLCASFDAQTVLAADGHTFIETTWAKREFKHHAGLVEKIEAKVRKAAG